MAKAPKRVSQTHRGVGILNMHGDLWSPRVFDSEAEAHAYFDKFWQSPGFRQHDRPGWRRYKVAPVSSTTRVLKTRKAQP